MHTCFNLIAKLISNNEGICSSLSKFHLVDVNVFTLLREIAILHFWETRAVLKKLFCDAVDAVANTADV